MLIKRIGEHDLPLPQRESSGAAGYDLRATHNVIIFPGQRKLIPTGFAWRIHRNWVGLIRPRSGMAVRDGLDVMAGVIDSDYRGPVGVLLVNLGDRPVEVKVGDRIAQMVITLHCAEELQEVESLEDSARGENGFGSTGV